MADKEGDKEKQPPNCNEDTHCPNMINTYEGWDSETWECQVCGARFKLYYDEMQ